MTSYYWQAGDITDPVTMTLLGEPNNLDDAAAGDVTTSLFVSSPWSYNFGVLVAAHARLTGMIVWGAGYTLGQWQATFDAGITGPVSSGGAVVTNIGNYTVEFYDGVWHHVATGTFLYPAAATTIIGDFGGVVATRARICVTYDYTHDFPGHAGAGTAVVYLNDFRVAATFVQGAAGSTGLSFATIGDGTRLTSVSAAGLAHLGFSSVGQGKIRQSAQLPTGCDWSEVDCLPVTQWRRT